MPVPDSSHHRPPDGDLVHAPLVRWAAERPEQAAIIQDAHSDHARQLDFRQLLQALSTRPPAPPPAPGTVLLTSAADPLNLLLDFLAAIRQGQCAAVADPDWPAPTHAGMAAALQQSTTSAITPPRPDSPFYIGFTSGSTGLPKGFRRHHRSWVESFRVTLQTFGPIASGRVLAPGRMSHSLFLFGALLGLWTGGGTSVQSRFSAERTLATLADGSCPVMVSVPSQLMLLITAAQRRSQPPIPQLRLLLITGSRWAHDHTAPLQALFPEARIITFYGASETSYVSWMPAGTPSPPTAVGRPFANVQIRIGPSPSQPAAKPRSADSPHADTSPGLIWIRSPMVFMDYVNGHDATAARREGDWLTVRDMGWLSADGLLHLIGRENRMIITQAKNLFPEEIETCLMSHPDITQAAVLGLPDPLRGQVVHAVLQCKSVCPPAAATEGALPLQPLPAGLMAHCRQLLDPYKIPRHWWHWQGHWPMTASGKTDLSRLYQALQSVLQTHLS